jgi:hypothetical protein
VCAEKLDGLMVVVCKHLKSRAEEPDRLNKVSTWLETQKLNLHLLSFLCNLRYLGI